MNRDHTMIAGMVGLLAMSETVSIERRPRYRRESKPGQGFKRKARVIKGTRYEQRPKRSR
jgi:hypothetical protein